MKRLEQKIRELQTSKFSGKYRKIFLDLAGSPALAGGEPDDIFLQVSLSPGGTCLEVDREAEDSPNGIEFALASDEGEDPIAELATLARLSGGEPSVEMRIKIRIPRWEENNSNDVSIIVPFGTAWAAFEKKNRGEKVSLADLWTTVKVNPKEGGEITSDNTVRVVISEDFFGITEALDIPIEGEEEYLLSEMGYEVNWWSPGRCSVSVDHQHDEDIQVLVRKEADRRTALSKA